ncbi:MAG: DUF2946 family protein [Rubrivivax sp.]
MLPRRGATAWIALLAMLAFALLPTVSRALASAGGPAWAEVCTPQGARWAPLDDGDGAPQPTLLSLDHCALCALATDGAAAPPPAAPVLALPLRSAEAPPLFLHAARTLPVWRSAQPRGPPVSG